MKHTIPNPSYVHRAGEEPLIGEPIDAFLERVAARGPDRDAVVSIPQGLRLSYAELRAGAERVARGLMGLGVERGDRVGIWSTSNAEWVLVQCAAARIGAVLVNLSPASASAELRHALELARVQVLVMIPGREGRSLDMLDAIERETLSDLRTVVVFDPADAAATTRPAPGFTTWSELLAAGEEVSAEAVAARAATLDADDPVNIQYTSGTTGRPKAVVLTHHGILNNAYFTGVGLGLSEQSRVCVPVPFHHCFGMVVGTLACLAQGAAVVIPSDRFDAAATLEAIERERCTALYGVPTMFIGELEELEERSYDLTSLRHGVMGGAPCPPALVRRVIDELGVADLRIAYGQTEASPITNLTRPEDPEADRYETVGPGLPFQEIKIVDPETGRVVPLGEIGEICFRGYHVMRGYFDQPDATAETIDASGWLHSGDLGTLDEHGRVRVTGRRRDMIIRGGENIYPAAIEACYSTHPDVAEVAVFGVPDERYGEQVGAWIRLRDGDGAEPAVFKEYVAGRLGRHQVPTYMWFVDELPKTPTGKVQKFKIKETVAAWLDAPEEAVKP